MKYLVYKITGGISHMLFQINNCVHLSKVTGRHLIIDTYHWAFQKDFNDYFDIPDLNYSTNYDILYNDERIDNNKLKQYIDNPAQWVSALDIRLSDLSLSKRSTEIIDNTDDIIFCSIVNDIIVWDINHIKNSSWYIKVKSEIVDTLKSIDYDYIGFHFRNTDISNDLDSFIEKINELGNKTKNIYLSTDDYFAFNNLKLKLDDSFNIIQYTSPPKLKEGQTGIHWLADDYHTIITNSLIDLYHLTNSTYFIPSENSGFSLMVSKLRERDDFFI